MVVLKRDKENVRICGDFSVTINPVSKLDRYPIEGLLQGISGVVVYLDNILISGSSEDQHLAALDEVLSRLDRAGLRAKKSKCEFLRSSVTYISWPLD